MSCRYVRGGVGCHRNWRWHWRGSRLRRRSRSTRPPSRQRVSSPPRLARRLRRRPKARRSSRSSWRAGALWRHPWPRARRQPAREWGMPRSRMTSLTSRLPTAPPRSLRRPAPLPPLCRKERGKRQPAPRRAGGRQEPLGRPSRPPWRVLRHLRARRRALQDLPRALLASEGLARLPPWPENHKKRRPGGRQPRAERRRPVFLRVVTPGGTAAGGGVSGRSSPCHPPNTLWGLAGQSVGTGRPAPGGGTEPRLLREAAGPGPLGLGLAPAGGSDPFPPPPSLAGACTIKSPKPLKTCSPPNCSPSVGGVGLREPAPASRGDSGGVAAFRAVRIPILAFLSVMLGVAGRGGDGLLLGPPRARAGAPLGLRRAQRRGLCCTVTGVGLGLRGRPERLGKASGLRSGPSPAGMAALRPP